MPSLYALNNFNKAIRVLTKEGLGKREWLSSIYVEHLCQLELTDIPDSLRSQFIQLRKMLKFDRTACKSGILQATIDAMDDTEVDHVFSLILAMHEEIVQLMH